MSFDCRINIAEYYPQSVLEAYCLSTKTMRPKGRSPPLHQLDEGLSEAFTEGLNEDPQAIQLDKNL